MNRLEVNKLCEEYYKYHPAGGPLHVVLDDGNLTTDNIIFCLEEVFNDGDCLGTRIAIELLKMKCDDRVWLYEQYPYGDRK